MPIDWFARDELGVLTLAETLIFWRGPLVGLPQRIRTVQ